MSRRMAILVVGLVAVALALWSLRGVVEDADPPASDDASQAQGKRRGVRPEPLPALSVQPRFMTQARAAATGRVSMGDGTPVTEATVCAQLDGTPVASVLSREPTCTRTGPDGRYRLEDLWPLQYSFDASAPRFAPTRFFPATRAGVVPLQPGRTREGVDFVLSPGIRVHGIVRDISGGAIADALLVATRLESPGAEGRAFARSDADGRFELWADEGSVSLTAHAQGYASGGTDGSAPGAELEVFLTPQAVVVGSVRHARTGQPVAGIEVELQGSAYSGWRTGSTYSDEAGNFKVERLHPGVVRPVARSVDLFGRADSVVVGLMQTSTPVVIDVHPVRSVRGRVVVAGTGEPCVEGSVVLQSDDGTIAGGAIQGDGTVELSPLQPGTYSVAPTCGSFLSANRYPQVVVGAQSVGELQWEVKRGASIRGVLVDSEGRAAAGRTVVARAAAGETQGSPTTMSALEFSRFTDEDGVFSLGGLAAGTHSLYVIEHFGLPLSRELELELGEGEVREGVELTMRSIAEVGGEVRDVQGNPLAGVVVEAMPDEGFAVRAHSDASGRFRLTGLIPGAGNLFVSERVFETRLRRPGRASADAEGFRYEVDAGENDDIHLVVEAADATITGRVVDSGGAPVGDAFVDLARLGDDPGASRRQALARLTMPFRHPPALTDVSGAFTIEGVPDGTYVVQALREGGGYARGWDVAAGDDVVLAIEMPCEIAGTVRLPGGGTPGRFGLHVDAHGGLAEREERYFESAGRWRVGGLPPGTYRIIATAAAGAAITEVEVSAGEVHDGIELVLAPRVTARGRVVELQSGEPIANRHVQIVPRGNSIILGGAASADKKEITGADGRFEVKAAPSGEITISITAAEPGPVVTYPFVAFAPATIDASAGVEVDVGDVFLPRRRLAKAQRAGDLGFTLHDTDESLPAERRRQVVSAVRDGGPAEAAGLRPGDVIVSVDGHDIRGTLGYLYPSLASAPPGTSLTLGLAREAMVTVEAGAPR